MSTPYFGKEWDLHFYRIDISSCIFYQLYFRKEENEAGILSISNILLIHFFFWYNFLEVISCSFSINFVAFYVFFSSYSLHFLTYLSLFLEFIWLIIIGILKISFILSMNPLIVISIKLSPSRFVHIKNTRIRILAKYLIITIRIILPGAYLIFCLTRLLNVHRKIWFQFSPKFFPTPIVRK